LDNQRKVWGEKRWGLRQANGNWGPENGKGPSSVNYIRARGPEKGNYKRTHIRTTKWHSQSLVMNFPSMLCSAMADLPG
jgi:hypothetical protein